MKGKKGRRGGGRKKAGSRGTPRKKRQGGGGVKKAARSRKRGGGRPGKDVPVGSRFMRTVTTAKITELRDAAPEGSEDYRVYDACLMRRSKRMALRKIAGRVGIPYQTLRRRLIACNSRREATRHPDKKYIDRGKYYALIIGDNDLYGGVGEMNEGKNGRPFVYGNEVFKMAAVFKGGTGIAYRPLEGLIRLQAGGRKRTPSYSQIRKRIGAIEIASGDADGPDEGEGAG